MTTQDTAAFPVPAAARVDILGYASSLLHWRDRADGARVAELAMPLLEWAGCASSKDDFRLRMNALSRASQNTCMRKPPLTPAELLEQAGIYYAFITDTAA